MAEEKAAEKRLSISKIYMKDFSFESPQAPGVFRQADWKPKTDLNLRSSHTALEDDRHEIILTITVEAKTEDKTLFLIELQQAGIFEISGYEGDEFNAIIGSFCPNILFPYARESIASLIQKGGFPEFVLQPINFDALYFQAKQQQAAVQSGEAETH
ncbi:MAG: protein-export chaperone SecB [Proteobacteria bacterium]|nr:protein-export chaperone SecB [Pseudomonadota bacterium]